MTTLEEYFTSNIQNESEEIYLDPINRTIMAFPIFCNGKIYDISTIEALGWKDPESLVAINPEDIDKKVIVSVDKLIEKFLEKHTMIYVEEKITNKLVTEISSKMEEGVISLLELISMIGNRRRRVIYKTTAKLLLKIIEEHSSTFICKNITQLSDKERQLFLDFILNWTVCPHNNQLLENQLISQLIDDFPGIFKTYPPEKTINLLKINSLPTNTPYFFMTVSKLVKQLHINPIKYNPNLNIDQKLELIKTISISNVNNFTVEESNILIQYDDSIPLIPDDPLSYKIQAVEAHLLRLKLQEEKEKQKELNNYVEQLKHHIYITSLLPSVISLRFISRADPTRCLTASPVLLRCEKISKDPSFAKYQEWILTTLTANDGRICYSLTNSHYNKCVDNDGGSNEPGNNIIIYQKSGHNSPNQQWQILQAMDAFVTLRNTSTHGYISCNEGEVSLQFKNGDDIHQHFTMVPFNE